MAGVTLSGTTTKNATVNIYRANRFQPHAMNSTAPVFPEVGRPAPANPDATTTSDANGVWSVTTASSEGFINATLNGANVAKFSFTPYVEPPHAPSKPVISGSRGGNAALASLLTGLQTLGWVTDNTTA